MNENFTKTIVPSKLGWEDLDITEVAEKLVKHIESISLADEFELDLRNCYMDYNPCSKIFDAIFKNLLRSHGTTKSKKIRVLTHVDLGSSKTMAECLLRSSEVIGVAMLDSNKFNKELLVKYCTENRIVLEVFSVTHSWVPDDPVTPYVLSAK